MSEWYGDIELLDEEIGTEEAAVCLWEEDIAELTSGDWEQLMGGPDDREFERMDELAEEASMRALEKEELEAAASNDWEWEEEDGDEEMAEYEGERVFKSKPVDPIAFVDEADIPF